MQDVNFNTTAGMNLSNWHVVDQSGVACEYPPIYGKFGPGFGHTWIGYSLPQANPSGNCGHDGFRINGFESNGVGHFWPQTQLVPDYTQDTHAQIKAFDLNDNSAYVFNLKYNAHH